MTTTEEYNEMIECAGAHNKVVYARQRDAAILKQENVDAFLAKHNITIGDTYDEAIELHRILMDASQYAIRKSCEIKELTHMEVYNNDGRSSCYVEMKQFTDKFTTNTKLKDLFLMIDEAEDARWLDKSSKRNAIRALYHQWMDTK